MLRTPKKFQQSKCSSGNLICDKSDHLPNFMILDIDSHCKNERPFIRIFSENKIKVFSDQIINEQPILQFIQDGLLTNHDSDLIYSEIQGRMTILLNKYFPLVRLSRKKAKDKPWITDSIKRKIKIRNQLYQNYLKLQNDRNKVIWKRFRNKVTTYIRNAETDYQRNLIHNHTNSCQQMWKLFGKTINNSKAKRDTISHLNINNKIIKDKETISKEINQFFCTIGSNLSNSIPNSQNVNPHRTFLQNQSNENINLLDISMDEIIKEIDDLEEEKIQWS